MPQQYNVCDRCLGPLSLAAQSYEGLGTSLDPYIHTLVLLGASLCGATRLGCIMSDQSYHCLDTVC